MTFSEEIPVMTLSCATLFPHAVMPLHIFEPRYREMLEDVLAKDRMFAIATLDEEKAMAGDESEPPLPYITIGVIRACHQNKDGTSNLVLAGVRRAKIEKIVQEKPYRVIQVCQIKSVNARKSTETLQAKARLVALLNCLEGLGAPIHDEALRLIESFDEPEITVDLAAYALIGSLEVKMNILGERDVLKRYQIATDHLQGEVTELKLDHQLRGDLKVEEVDFN